MARVNCFICTSKMARGGRVRTREAPRCFQEHMQRALLDNYSRLMALTALILIFLYER